MLPVFFMPYLVGLILESLLDMVISIKISIFLSKIWLVYSY